MNVTEVLNGIVDCDLLLNRKFRLASCKDEQVVVATFHRNWKEDVLKLTFFFGKYGDYMDSVSASRNNLGPVSVSTDSSYTA